MRVGTHAVSWDIGGLRGVVSLPPARFWFGTITSEESDPFRAVSLLAYRHTHSLLFGRHAEPQHQGI